MRSRSTARCRELHRPGICLGLSAVEMERMVGGGRVEIKRGKGVCEEEAEVKRLKREVKNRSSASCVCECV